jgi:Asp-tRNA(Asn)/Glu-tRNA(Gln) amidotransferase A subunit family amidase
MQTIHAAAADIRAGRLSPVDLLETCLERFRRFEPNLHAWVLVDHHGARTEAKRLTDELKRGQYRGPLHGIPIGIKDIFDVFDWPTAAGSRLWANSIARQDATVVRKLREAGAVLVGKTVTTQYATAGSPGASRVTAASAVTASCRWLTRWTIRGRWRGACVIWRSSCKRSQDVTTATRKALCTPCLII